MPNLRLTRRVVDDIPFAESGQVLYRDTLLSGFGLRVGSRSKVYFAEGQVDRTTRRVTIGRADLLAPETARKKALTLLGDMTEGRNPTEEKRKETGERITLALAFERFFAARDKLSPITVNSYLFSQEEVSRDVIAAHLGGEQPIAIYLFDGASTKVAALDIDNHGGELEWQQVAEKIRPLIADLRSMNLTPYVVRSGGGSPSRTSCWRRRALTPSG